jgi:DNA-binding PadR family transcriptional regulator
MYDRLSRPSAFLACIYGFVYTPRAEYKSLKVNAFQILLALAECDRHGLEIMRDVLERTEGDLHLWPGMLYGTLKELVDAELVVERRPPPEVKAGGGRPRYYGITERGRRVCAAEAERLDRYVQAARARNVLKPAGGR